MTNHITIDGRTINAEFAFPGTAGDELACEVAGFAQFPGGDTQPVKKIGGLWAKGYF